MTVLTQPSAPQTALHRAVLSSPEAAALLMVHGGDVHGTTPSGDSPLTLAASVAESRGFGSVNVRMLIQRGADASHRTVRGSTALHAAAAQCAPDTVRLLLDSGRASPVAVDREGNTPLHLAAAAVNAAGGNEHRGLQAIRLLLLAGGDPCARNSAGATPIALASNRAAAEMLERALAGDLPEAFTRRSISGMREALPSWVRVLPRGEEGALRCSTGSATGGEDTPGAARWMSIRTSCSASNSFAETEAPAVVAAAAPLESSAEAPRPCLTSASPTAVCSSVERCSSTRGEGCGGGGRADREDAGDCSCSSITGSTPPGPGGEGLLAFAPGTPPMTHPPRSPMAEQAPRV